MDVSRRSHVHETKAEEMLVGMFQGSHFSSSHPFQVFQELILVISHAIVTLRRLLGVRSIFMLWRLLGI